MSLAPALPEVCYPESDGKPMADTDIHWRLMVYTWQVLEWLYRGQKVYFGSNMLMYYRPRAELDRRPHAAS